MDEIDWRRVRSLVGEALELLPQERAAFLERACGGDEQLRRAVERLIAREGSAEEEFLEPPAELAPAKEALRLGEFELVEEIGRGGMGVVYRARQSSLGRDVAVKVFVESLTSTPQEVERFHREARSAARLHHPGIVQVLTDGQSGSTHWFAMELVAGHDLGREIQLQRRSSPLAGQKPFLPPFESPAYLPAVAKLVAEVADALQHAHAAGVVHRDVKPANLLLEPGGRAQLVDFGLVRDDTLGSVTQSGELRGTPHYMSPEQAKVRAVRVDHRTDVYSLGVVLYELATLRRPFDGRTSAEVLQQIRVRDPQPLRKVNPRAPRDLELVCNTAMAKELGARYADAAALAADLRRFLAGEPVHAKAPSVVELALRHARRRRWPLVALVLLALGLAVGALLASERARAEQRAQLSVELRDESGRAVPGRAFLRPIDPITGMPGPLRSLGKLPLRSKSVEPGYARIVLRPAQGGQLELTRTLEAGRSFALDARTRPSAPSSEGMVWIPGGRLALRDPDSPLLCINGRDLELEGFWLDAHEVSNAQYRLFLAATGHPPPRNWEKVLPGEHDLLPVVEVGWEDALAFAEYSQKRLPTFAEWTFAARGGENRIYPWPDAVKGELRGNVSQPLVPRMSHELFDHYLGSASPVDAHPEASTASGLYNMFGNVAEWTESPVASPKDGTFELRPADRLVAGHHWNSGTRGHSLATYSFAGVEDASAAYFIGFRCARSAAP